MSETINVVCLALPTGENLWFDTEERDAGYLNQVIDKWKEEHPEFKDANCTMGAIEIKMPKANYIAIGAQIGPGCFEWP